MRRSPETRATAHEDEQNFSFEALPFLTFGLIALTVTPPNYLYQKWLEDTFPARVANDGRKTTKRTDGNPIGKNEDNGNGNDIGQGDHLSKSNTLAKFCLDQSLGAVFNTVAFIFLTGLFRGKPLDQLGRDVHRDLLPMLRAGWRVWPIVTLTNLVVVPFEFRHIVGNTVGVLWGAYITLKNL